jgi:hypothetical protein
MPFPYEEFDLAGLRTYPLKSRKSKAHAEQFAKPYKPGTGMAGWLDSLPSILAADEFRAIVAALVNARRSNGGIVWGLGAHVIKTGLSPVLIDLMERGFVSALATNGAGMIHDFEIALVGATSEDVEQALGVGQFGMADETGRLLNAAINEGVAAGLGIGQSVGRYLCERHPQHERASLAGLTTVTLDFARLYRPQTNVVSRPVAGTSGHGHYLVGHHEIMIPLLAAALVEESKKPC